VVALAPSAAEILFALGAADRVVGVSDFAKDLPEARGTPTVGGFAPDLERVVSLAPDLVVASRDGTDRAAFEKLKSLGLPVLATTGASLTGVLEDIRAVGKALGEPSRAAELVASLEKRIQAAEAKAKATGRRATALAVIWPDPPVVAGRTTFVGDLLAHAGLDNAAPASAGEWPRVSHETLATWEPDLVIRPDTPENRAAFERSFTAEPRWRLLKAVREGRVITLPGALLERPGPGLVEALERLVKELPAALRLRPD
jgi:iron complex transport system substrate-binding protein